MKMKKNNVTGTVYSVKDFTADPRSKYGGLNESIYPDGAYDHIPDKYIDTGTPYRHEYFYTSMAQMKEKADELREYYNSK